MTKNSITRSLFSSTFNCDHEIPKIRYLPTTSTILFFPRSTRRRRPTYLFVALSVMETPALLPQATVEFVGSRSTAKGCPTLTQGHVVGTISAARKPRSGLGLGHNGLGQSQNRLRTGGKDLQQAQRQHQEGQQQRNQWEPSAGWKALNPLCLEVRRQNPDNFHSWSPSSSNIAGRTWRTSVGASS